MKKTVFAFIVFAVSNVCGVDTDRPSFCDANIKLSPDESIFIHTQLEKKRERLSDYVDKGRKWIGLWNSKTTSEKMETVRYFVSSCRDARGDSEVRNVEMVKEDVLLGLMLRQEYLLGAVAPFCCCAIADTNEVLEKAREIVDCMKVVSDYSFLEACKQYKLQRGFLFPLRHDSRGAQSERFYIQCAIDNFLSMYEELQETLHFLDELCGFANYYTDAAMRKYSRRETLSPKDRELVRMKREVEKLEREKKAQEEDIEKLRRENIGAAKIPVIKYANAALRTGEL